MERQYSHLTWKNRLKIRRMLDERRKPKEIADALHVHTSTIYREIKRGQTWQMTSEWEYVQKYCPETAERKYRENLQAKGPDLKIGNDHALASYLEEKIGKEHYSPAAALAKIKEEGRIFSVEISEWTLYSYIDKGVFATITNKSLPTGKKKKHPYRKVQEARLPKGDGIEDRSEEINSRKTFGHWEMDTVVSARRSKKRLLVLTERLTRWEIIELMKDGTSASVVAALNRMERVLVAHPTLSVPEWKELLYKEAIAIREEDAAACRQIGENCLELLRPGMGILTHCNAGHLAVSEYGTALAPIYLGQERGYGFKVFADETRPLLQGARLTAYELSRAGVDVTLICDNMASVVMRKGWVHAVVVGCDRVAANGDVANKIGTSGVAILARHYKIPFYVLGPTSTIDGSCPDGDSIVIEERNPDEVTEMWYSRRMAPKDVKVYNPAFDITPHELITAIITEKGIFYKNNR